MLPMLTKRVWRIFLVTLLIALPVRLYQTLFLLEPETGFYKDGSVSTAIVFIALMAGCVLLYADMARSPAPVPQLPVRSLPAAAASMFTGFLFCGQSLFSLLGVPSVENELMNRILAAAGILAGLALLVQAYGHAVGRNFWERYPLPALLPPVWGCACLVALFLTYSGSVNIAENVYDTFSVVFLLLFFFAYAKLHAGMEPERSARNTVRYGLMAIAFAAVTVLPELLLRLTGVSPVTSYPFGMYLMNGMAAIFILCFLLALRRAPEALGAEAETSAAEPAAPAAEQPAGAKEEGPSGTEEAAQKPEEAPLSEAETENCAQQLQEAFGAQEAFLPRGKSPFPKKNMENQR